MPKPNYIVVHINEARTGDAHPEALPAHRLVLSCEALHGYPKCMGAANLGPERCTCDDTLTAEQHEQCLRDAWKAFRARAGELCDDCAFRKGSPESDSLADIAASPQPFRCHKGMPLDARSGMPAKDAYAPVMRRTKTGIEAPDYPICEGWRRARAARGP